MKAVVLAGGKSSRMGQDKALMKMSGKTMIQHVVDNLAKVFDEVFISGNRSGDPVPMNVIKDRYEQKGPMEGIRSALEHCQEDIFVCSCDMPFVSTELMKDILQRRAENKISIAECEGKVYPVLGIYPYVVLDVLANSIKNDRLRMTRFLEQQDAHYIQYDESFRPQFLNINTPESFWEAERMINKLELLKIRTDET
ncbi:MULTISPECIES: molybdenum cofactor guanylyltransferase [Chryseobacterium]|uniref:Probable molybdenum cofactor guanylyltransferase n=3 Tax=Flavobacteriales TaxID=200644 RepID=A0A3N0VYJ8_9FLAO|nr:MULTISPECIES: molybdenum cofactor guanylyltransferase [Chryseobacterium]TXI88181.1 MAG: molybdenum cofactor guanylyltransferase [Chryseobacterium sp.]MCC3215592.1 molybdenum cofactor guanylyltransferase [Chryseobacterium sp. X308]MDH5033825.1 molybdenum cofactor guanylyltransferase [Chryseobacterium cucumeris]MDR6462722.1 molybdopterin-guanine dinucleotide biosynthesis protein A [Chryseobacterium sediminis]RKE81660.1 molybdenum cofactor guanylyltransferase [Chryseobacterium sp. AG363]